MSESAAQAKSLDLIVRSVVGKTRPEEMIIVDSVLSANARSDSEKMLGFADPSVMHGIVLLAPVLIAFLKEAAKGSLKILAEEIGKAVSKHLVSSSSSSALALDVNKLKRVREEFTLRLKAAGFNEDHSVAAADALTSTITAHPEWVKGLVSD